MSAYNQKQNTPLLDKPVSNRSDRYLLMILCALIFSSCASPATPAPVYMAFVDIPKPHRTPEAMAFPALPTATPLPTASTLNVSIWAPPYLAETLSGALEDPLEGLFVTDAATANVKLEVGEQNRISQWVYALVTPFFRCLWKWTAFNGSKHI
jgi:hypothetical protein